MKYIILGIIQGLTEFIPVSSSGHMVLAQKILNIKQDILDVIIFSHLGTLVAVFFYFFKDILEIMRSLRLVIHIFIATIITAILALCFRSYFESMFNMPWLINITLIINGIILLITRFSLRLHRHLHSLGIKDSIGFGFAQGLAIIPGISRSGITISYLMWRGLNKDDAFKFSFLAGIPAIIGAFIMEIDLKVLSSSEVKKLMLCFWISFLSGVFALWILKKILHKKMLHYFGYYCIIAGILFMFIR